MFSSQPTFVDFIRRAQEAHPGDQLYVAKDLSVRTRRHSRAYNDPELNKKTWKVFKTAVEKAFPRRRFKNFLLRKYRQWVEPSPATRRKPPSPSEKATEKTAAFSNLNFEEICNQIKNHSFRKDFHRVKSFFKNSYNMLDQHFLAEGKDILTLGSHLFEGKEILTSGSHLFGGPSKAVQHICARYGLDWEKMIRSDLHLEKFYIECFGIGAASPSTYHLEQHLPWNKLSLSNCSVAEIHELYQEATQFKYIGEKLDPREISGTPRNIHEYLITDYFSRDLQRCNLYEGIGDLISKDPRIPPMHPYWSRLAMGICCMINKGIQGENDERDLNLIIPAPTGVNGEVDYYKVHDTVSYGGMTVIALTPVSNASSLPPIIMFRCTEQAPRSDGAVESNLQDMEVNVGKSGYTACREKLAHLMKDPEFTKWGKCKALFYSLGGAQFGYFAQDPEFQHWKQMDEIVGFNFVGNDDEVITSLADQVNALPKEDIPPSFYIHRNTVDGDRGDWVNKTREKHVGWGISHPNAIVQVYEWMIDDKEIPENSFDLTNMTHFWRSMDIHSVRPMDAERDYQYNFYSGTTRCNDVLEVKDRTIENLRLEFGNKIFYKFAKFIHFIFEIFSQLIGIEFFKKNKH